MGGNVCTSAPGEAPEQGLEQWLELVGKTMRPSSEAEDGVLHHIPTGLCSSKSTAQMTQQQMTLHPCRMTTTKLECATHTIPFPGSPTRKQIIDLFFTHILK